MKTNILELLDAGIVTSSIHTCVKPVDVPRADSDQLMFETGGLV